MITIREAVFYINCLDNEKTIEILSTAMEKYKSILNVMSTINDFKEIKSDALAKMAGTRLQAYTNLITPTTDNERIKEYYEQAVKDSDFAINQFVSDSDKKRQYQYRCMLELSVDNYDEATKYLMKCANVNNNDFNKFIEYVSNISDFSKHFLMNNYFAIMSKTINKNYQLSTNMYNAVINNKNIKDLYFITGDNDESLFTNNNNFINTHPFEMIFFNIGNYYIENNKSESIKYFDKAIEICESIDESAFKVLNLTISSNRILVSNNIEKDKEELINKYNELINNNDYQIINKYLNKLKDKFNTLNSTSDTTIIKKVCKEISNEIKV